MRGSCDSTLSHTCPLKSSCKNVVVPRSIPGLVTQRMLVMEYLDGTQITRLGSKMDGARCHALCFANLPTGLSESKRAMAKRMIMSNVGEAYGRMLLLDGLFQADGHPGNILVLRGARGTLVTGTIEPHCVVPVILRWCVFSCMDTGGKVGLLDYGQSKKLPDDERMGFAALILALGDGNPQRVSDAMWDLGIVTDKNDAKLRTRMAYDMFDTAGTCVCCAC